ncbi:MAG: hypothetical protein GX557_12440 [Chloroflexi bacterium]|nr:hypothetical protein [Chloroflexota bacterium]
MNDEIQATSPESTRALSAAALPRDQERPDRQARGLMGDLLTRVGAAVRLPDWPGRFLKGKGTLGLGPDGTVVVYGGRVPRNAGGWTHGNWIILRHHDPPLSPRRVRAQLNHEYVHVLQYRADGMWRFYWRYLRSLVMALFKRCTVWEISPYERIGVEIETLYLEHPELPNLWELVEDARDASVR